MSGQNGSGPPPPPSVRDVLGATAVPASSSPSEPPAPVRRFRVDDREWIARVSGECAYGTGRVGAASLSCVDFAPASAPERPLRRALLPRGRFSALFDDELRRLFDEAGTIVPEGSSNGG